MAIQQYDDDQTDDIMIHLVPELRQRIKIAAAQSNLSVQEYIERILEQTVPPEANSAQIRTGRLNRAAVDELLRFLEELKRAHPGQVFEDSVETLRQIREERTRELEQR
jgi:predicted metal-dependent RNase